MAVYHFSVSLKCFQEGDCQVYVWLLFFLILHLNHLRIFLLYLLTVLCYFVVLHDAMLPCITLHFITLFCALTRSHCVVPRAANCRTFSVACCVLRAIAMLLCQAKDCYTNYHKYATVSSFFSESWYSFLLPTPWSGKKMGRKALSTLKRGTADTCTL